MPGKYFAMSLLLACTSSILYLFAGRLFSTSQADQITFNENGCPYFTEYSMRPHGPYSNGSLRLPFQRPSEDCRTFSSPLVEETINELKGRIADPDIARLFENCFPNTLDTTIRWHVNGSSPRSFIVTGDINAEWIRDSQRQLGVYQPLANNDQKIRELILGAIHTQTEFMSISPYCNAFNPPLDSGILFEYNDYGHKDVVFPPYNPRVVFECKYELDSVASYFGLANEYYASTKDTSFVTEKWLSTARKLYGLLREQSLSTFDDFGNAIRPRYSFKRNTDIGSETLVLEGSGHPVNNGTSLVRSAFRPSDDATVFQFFIPANAQLAVELKRTALFLREVEEQELADIFAQFGEAVETSIWEDGTYVHREFGKVFAYEVDGYGAHSNLDDANIPSLLSLPDLGFVEVSNEVYQNTRRMILSKRGNPYYLTGPYFDGIGGPHIGIRNAWPMSHLVRIRTTDDDEEIKRELNIVKMSTGGLGLMHETVRVDIPPGTPDSFTRPWFAWANSEFGKTILDLAQRKPHLIFKESQNSPYYLSEK